MDTAIRTLRLETSKKQRPNTPCCPTSAGSSQRDPYAPFPKELGLPSLEAGMISSYNRKKESKMVVAKRQRREKPVKIEQRKVQGPEWGPQVKQTALLASPICIGQAQGEEKKHIKKEAKIGPGASLLLVSFGLACPHTSRMYFPLLSK